MGEHLIDGEFQSDKYPTTPRGKVPLSCKDPMAKDLLWEYAQRRRIVDPAFATDLEQALRHAGYAGAGVGEDDFKPTHRHYKGCLYQKLFEANHTETTEELVVYRSEDKRFWCRPWSMFHGTVGIDGKDIPRFEALR